MPNIKSAIKRTKTNNERRAHNVTIKSAMRTAIKQVEVSVANNDAEQAKLLLLLLQNALTKPLKLVLYTKTQLRVTNQDLLNK